MQAVVTLSEALELMRSGEPFDLIWVTADRQRQRGGEILTAKGARQVMKRKPQSGNRKPEYIVRSARRRVHGGSDPVSGHPVSDTRNPNHYAHGTRNIRLSNGKVRKVHIQLIDSINGMKVV